MIDMTSEPENLVPSEIQDWLRKISCSDFNTSAILAGDDASFEVLDPGSGQVLATLGETNEAQVSSSISLARATYSSGVWRNSGADDREITLHRIADLVQRDFDFLVTLEALDTGKPLAEAAFDIEEVVMVLRYYAGWANKLTGSTIAAPQHFAASTLRGPVGVCAAITPWNYPLPILMYKLAPALAFGNSFIAKPSELAPLSAIYFAELCQEAGVPDGVLTILLGAGKVGGKLTSSPGLDKIAFTGSTATGRSIMRSAAENITRVSLELGGKSPQVVFESADFESAVAGVAAGIWTNAGQVCVAGSRLIVQASIKDKFLDALMAATQEIQLGHSLDPESGMGPMITEAQRNKAQQVIDSAAKDGATILQAGQQSSNSGFFLRPTIIDGLASDHPVHQEEIFGPAIAVETFESEAEAIAKSNSTAFGLAAGIWTGAAGQGHRVAREITAGTVWINTYGAFHPTLPFGGTKASGFGRELGYSAVEAYTELKTLVEDISVRGDR